MAVLSAPNVVQHGEFRLNKLAENPGGGKGRKRCQESLLESGEAAMRDLMMIAAGGSRLEILRSLMNGAKDVSTLADDLELGLPMVSLNLRLLPENGG